MINTPLCFIVNAQDFWKALIENSSLNEIAMVMTKGNQYLYQVSTDAATTNVANAFAAFLEEENEESLELENWMTNENYFVINVYLEEETENPLELENWISNEIPFNSNSFFEKEREEELELQEWMVNNKFREMC